MDCREKIRVLKGYYLHPKKDILDSLENIGKNHRLYLLITDVL